MEEQPVEDKALELKRQERYFQVTMVLIVTLLRKNTMEPLGVTEEHKTLGTHIT